MGRTDRTRARQPGREAWGMLMGCLVPLCREHVSVDLRSAAIELCHRHAMVVVNRYEHTILAREELRRLQRDRESEIREATRQGNHNAEPVVYYARIGDYVKIGFSTRLRSRLATLRADELLAFEPGGPELERERHRQFAAERIDLRRENFRTSESLESHIAALRDANGLPEWASRPRTSEITTRSKESTA